MANILIKYNDETVLTVTDEDQLDLSHKLKLEENIDDTDNIKGWIIHSIKHFITRKIGSCADSVIVDNEEQLSQEEELVPTDRSSIRNVIRGKSWYRNRDGREEDERLARIAEEEARIEEEERGT